jgi:hypothetical protein
MSDKKYRPSCGSEGADFMAIFCDRCVRDEAFQRDPANNDGCFIAARTMAHDVNDPEYPSEWIYGEDGRPTCTAFDPITHLPTPPHEGEK